MKSIILAVACLVFGGISGALADHKDLNLLVAPELASSGLMTFLLPRFSLKTGVKIHFETLGNVRLTRPPLRLEADAGTPVLSQQGQVFGISNPGAEDPGAKRLHDWLLSNIGQRTISQFAPDGVQLFEGAAGVQVAAQKAVVNGDLNRGETLAYDNCGRCHVIGARNRMNGIGSTPSFALLRGFDDWEDRFRAFYALNPHPSFTQIEGVTDPFDKTRPPPISPLVLSQTDHDDIVAFTASITPVDLGAPLVHQ